MSFKAVAWAMDQDLRPAALKWLLVVCADIANDEGRLWPPVDYLADISSLDRKTVMKYLDELVELGHLQDTLERVGPTRSGRVFLMPSAARYRRGKRSKNGTASPGEAVPNFPRSYPKNGTASLITEEPTNKPTNRETRLSAQEASPPAEEFSLTPDLPPPPKKPHRIPENFAITEDMRQWAARETPHLDIDRATPEFIDYWQARADTGAKKLDWVATWRNRMRELNERGMYRRAAPPRPGEDRGERELNRVQGALGAEIFYADEDDGPPDSRGPGGAARARANPSAR